MQDEIKDEWIEAGTAAACAAVGRRDDVTRAIISAVAPLIRAEAEADVAKLKQDKLDLQERNDGLRGEALAFRNEAAALRADLAQARAQIEALRKALDEGRRAIGDHYAPSDCYATGPLTGDPFRDLVECPACSFILKYDVLKEPSHDH